MNYWAVKCNPDDWDYQAYLAQHGSFTLDPELAWQARVNWRWMKPDDGVALLFGKGIGLGCLGTVKAPAGLAWGDPFWVDPARQAEVAHYVPIRIHLDLVHVGRSVPLSTLRADPDLVTSQLIRTPNAANAVKLTAAQFAALQRLAFHALALP